MQLLDDWSPPPRREAPLFTIPSRPSHRAKFLSHCSYPPEICQIRTEDCFWFLEHKRLIMLPSVAFRAAHAFVMEKPTHFPRWQSRSNNKFRFMSTNTCCFMRNGDKQKRTFWPLYFLCASQGVWKDTLTKFQVLTRTFSKRVKHYEGLKDEKEHLSDSKNY